MRTNKADELNTIQITDPKGALDAFVAVLRKHGLTYTGGCKPFYTPDEWKARGEEYGTTSLFIVVHDGGDVAHALEDPKVYAELSAALERHGAYIEGCTCWYSSVHAI